MPTNIFSDSELGSLNVKVIVEGVGTASGFESLTPGDYVELEAITDNNNDFLGWYDKNDELITKNDIYSFSIKKNESFIARFTDNPAEDDSVGTGIGDTTKSEADSTNNKGQQTKQRVARSSNNSSVDSNTSTHSKSSSGGGGSSTSSSTTDNTIVRGKGTDKAAYIKTGKGTVKYVKPIAKKKAIKITVPDTIKINGKSYKVTSIEKNAFENCKKLRSVTIGKNVKRGKEVFSGCKKLEKMTVISLHLTKKSVKNSLKNSYISIVVVPKKKKAAYSKIFSKKNTASRYPIIVKKMK